MSSAENLLAVHAMSNDQCQLVEREAAPKSSPENLLAVHAMSNDQCQLVERETAPKSSPENLLAVLRILVFLIQILILIPDSRAVYDLIFTLFILLTLSR